MPELPEVETVMRGPPVRLEGRRILRARINRPDLRRPFPDGLADRLTGARVLGFRRRAKYIPDAPGRRPIPSSSTSACPAAWR